MNDKELQKLIDKPNCEFNCPPDKPFSCGCDRCVAQIKRTWDLTAERDRRFSKEEIEGIDNYWVNDTVGFLGKNGCVLPRKFRPINCIEAICRYARYKLRDTRGAA